MADAKKTRVQQALAALDNFRDELKELGLEGKFEERVSAAENELQALQKEVEAASEVGDFALYYEALAPPRR
jgi:hypothetical protein